MTIETLEFLMEQARHNVYRGCNRFEVLQELIFQHELKEEKYINELESKVVGCNMYKALSIFGQEVLEEICNDKIRNYEKMNFFKGVKNQYCKKQLDLLTPAEIENANEVEVKAVLHEVTDLNPKRNRSNCPLCGGTNHMKFSFKNNLYKCFKCEESGNSIKLYQKLTGYNFKQTVRNLNNL